MPLAFEENKNDQNFLKCNSKDININSITQYKENITNSKNILTKHSIMINFSASIISKKHILLLLIFSILFLFKPVYSQSELAKNLESEFNKIATSFPPNWEKYFYVLTSTGQIKIDKFRINELDYRLKKIHRFNEDVITNFVSIIWSEITVFKTFSFSINSLYTGYQEFVGAARINNNWVEIAYIEIETNLSQSRL